MNSEIEYLRSQFNYDPSTGFVTNKMKRSSRALIGDRAGYLNKKTGYRLISINNRGRMEHRIIYALVFGEWPKNQIDHKNCNRSDNRLCNLREATQEQNQHNTPPKNRITKGISWRPECQKWQCQIRHNKKRYFLGRFDSKHEAQATYNAKAKELHGEFFRGGEI